MTPLQKSIAEIEAMQGEVIHIGDSHSANAFQYCLDILTANLEYERDVIKDAYTQGHDDACDGNAGQRKEFTSGNDYYTKTYEHERKD